MSLGDPGWTARWLPNRIPFRLRIFFRGAFLLLALATVGLALSVLQEEKQLSYRNYRELFHKNVEQITARLQHPTGQLALLNPGAPDAKGAALHPLVLPFAAIDFDDKAKAQQAVEMAGCQVQYPDQAQLCLAIGNNALAGGFIYAVGAFNSGALEGHAIGDLDLSQAHRVRVQVSLRGQTYRWVAPLETASLNQSQGTRGRLTGFAQDEQGQLAPRPDKEFRGWLWQDPRCLNEVAASGQPDGCLKRAYFSVRLPIGPWRDELYRNTRMPWPPHDLAQVRVRLKVLAPGDNKALFDSDQDRSTAPFTLADLRGQLLVGEKLRIRKLQGTQAVEIASLSSSDEQVDRPSPLLSRITRQLPVEGYDEALSVRERVHTTTGDYELLVTGDVRSVNRNLSVVATRMSWFVAAMLGAIMVTWLAIEVRIVRRITVLTKRAASVKKSVNASDGLIQLDLEDIKSSDELGLLAGVLSDLMQRVNEDVKREQIRAEQEKDMWHAVGHEIMSPLQSLLALHGDPKDPSLRYIHRMQQAVRVLYGSASPSEAIQSANLSVSTLDVQAFLQHVAANAEQAGIARVSFEGLEQPVIVKAEEYALEDVITHVLSNADRYRTAGSTIRISLQRDGGGAQIRIHNEGPPIAKDLLAKVFEYGVSDAADSVAHSNRGQGLFVARTYMAKMGGTIEARNVDEGVTFVLTLALA